MFRVRSQAKTMFHYQLGNRERFNFWFDPWLDGVSLADKFPEINIESISIKKDIVVRDHWRNGIW